MTTPEQAPPQTNPNDRPDHTNERLARLPLARLEQRQRFLTDIVREIRDEQRDTNHRLDNTNKRIDTLIFVTIGAAATITAAVIGIGIAIILSL